MHLISSPIDWYAARAGGVAAYLILTAVLWLGLTMAAKRTSTSWPRFAIEDVHRVGGLLVGAFVGIHIVTIALDAYLPFSLWSLLVPFLSSYRPLWVALGIVAMELLLALAVTNHYRNRLVPYRLWRKAHYLNFAVWLAATAHLLGSGTDRSAVWLLALVTVAVGGVAGGAAVRFGAPRVGGAAAAAAGAGAVVALGLGPLSFHARTWNPVAFNDTLTGAVQRNFGPTRGIVSFAGEGHGGQRVLVRADLLIDPQRMLATSFQMEYLPSGLVCTGRVTGVQNFGFQAKCRPPRGLERLIDAHWSGAGTGAELQGGVLTARLGISS